MRVGEARRGRVEGWWGSDVSDGGHEALTGCGNLIFGKKTVGSNLKLLIKMI